MLTFGCVVNDPETLRNVPAEVPHRLSPSLMPPDDPGESETFTALMAPAETLSEPVPSTLHLQNLLDRVRWSKWRRWTEHRKLEEEDVTGSNLGSKHTQEGRRKEILL